MSKPNSSDAKQTTAASSGAANDVNRTSGSASSTASNSSQEQSANSETLVDVLSEQFGSDSDTEQGGEQQESSPIIGQDQEETSEGSEAASAEGESQTETTEETGEETTQEGEAEDADEAEDAETTGDESGEEPPPFHKHPRWQKLVKERDELREQVAVLDQVRPLVEQQQTIVDFCRANDISPEQFREIVELRALMNKNPEEALKRLKPMLQELGQFDGSALPSDLEQKVANGQLELEDAQEIAKLRAQLKHGTETSKKSEAQVMQERLATVQRANMDALAQWEKSMQQTDPDFRPKAKADDVDGMYELVVDKFKGAMMTTPPKNPQEVVKLLADSYNSVKKVFATRLVNRQPIRRPLQSASSARANAGESKTLLDEAIKKFGR